MIVGTVFLLILNQLEIHLVQKIEPTQHVLLPIGLTFYDIEVCVFFQDFLFITVHKIFLIFNLLD